MFDEIAIGGFKAFGPEQRIPIRPITLLYGPNSGGKSSILHFLLFAQHVASTGRLDVSAPTGAPETVDLGGFESALHMNSKSSQLTWEVSYGPDSLEEFAEDLGIRNSLNLRFVYGYAKNRARKSIGDPGITQISLLTDGEVALELDSAGEDFVVSRVGYHLPWIEAGCRAMGVHRAYHAEIPLVLQNLATRAVICRARGAFDFRFSLDRKHAPELDEIAKGTRNITLFHDERRKRKFQFLVLGERDIGTRLRQRAETRPEKLAASALDVLELLLYGLRAAAKRTELTLGNALYLGPLRSIPGEMQTIRSEDTGDVALGKGVAAWEALAEDEDSREVANEWLGKGRLDAGCQLKCERFFGEEAVSDVISRIAKTATRETSSGKKLSKAKLLTSFLDKSKELLSGTSRYVRLSLVDDRTNLPVSPKNVGTGISQVLPVIVYALSGGNRLVSIEQPELHLHPRLQAELGDLFIEAAFGTPKNRLVLETHSEHLLLRLMRRIRETTRNGQASSRLSLPPVTPEDIAVLYVEPLASGESIVRHIELDEEGGLLDDWPGGFFEEGFRERFGEG